MNESHERNEPPRYAALLPGFLQSVKDHAGKPIAQREFADYYRNQLGGRASVEHDWWHRLVTGKSVPADIAAGFVRLIKERWGWEAAAPETCCAPMPPPLAPHAEGGWRRFSLINDVIALLLRRYFTAAEEMCATAEDVPLAAEMIVHCVGHMTTRPGQPFDRRSCIERGERHMRTAEEAYASWLRRMHGRERHAVMFAVCGKKGKARRVAACVILPLREETARGLLEGRVGDLDLTPDDLESPSPFLYVHACGVAHELLPEVGEKKSSQAQMFCLMYQASYLSRDTGPWTPVLVSIATNDQFRERLVVQGFRSVGTKLHGTDAPLLVLDGGAESTSGKLQYEYFKDILAKFQKANATRWAAAPKKG